MPQNVICSIWYGLHVTPPGMMSVGTIPALISLLPHSALYVLQRSERDRSVLTVTVHAKVRIGSSNQCCYETQYVYLIVILLNVNYVRSLRCGDDVVDNAVLRSFFSTHPEVSVDVFFDFA